VVLLNLGGHFTDLAWIPYFLEINKNNWSIIVLISSVFISWRIIRDDESDKT